MNKNGRHAVLDPAYWVSKEFCRGRVAFVESQIEVMRTMHPGAPWYFWEVPNDDEGTEPWLSLVYFVPRIVDEQIPAVVAMYLCAPPKEPDVSRSAWLSLVHSEPDTAGVVH